MLVIVSGVCVFFFFMPSLRFSFFTIRVLFRGGRVLSWGGIDFGGLIASFICWGELEVGAGWLPFGVRWLWGWQLSLLSFLLRAFVAVLVLYY